MKVGMIGCGKLGKMIGIGMALRGVEVMGYDVNTEMLQPTVPEYEELPPNFEWPPAFTFAPLDLIVRQCELIFFAVQTPHDKEYEGITPAPFEPKDFDYTHIRAAVASAAREAFLPDHRTFVIISTMLPGTMERELLPLVLPDHVTMLYNPSFIAMGTTLRNFWNPELVLIGAGSAYAPIVNDRTSIAVDKLTKLYNRVLNNPPFHIMSIPSAELAKVAYNTAISQKIVLANTLMEICHKVRGANVDHVTGVLQAAIDRVASPAYLSGGMGDGGACHPRDNIAMMALAERLNLYADPFSFATRAREDQTNWLRDVIQDHRKRRPVVIVGYAYKPDCSLTFGSPALLLKNRLASDGIWSMTYDPVVEKDQALVPWDSDSPVCAFIGCRHSKIGEWLQTLPPRSIVIDPFRLGLHLPAGVDYVQIGIGT